MAGDYIIYSPEAGGGGGGSGTVTSVALALPASTFNISGSPVTTTGTLTGAFKTQSANVVFSGPTTGAAATPTWRALVAADLPNPLLLNDGTAGAPSLAFIATTNLGIFRVGSTSFGVSAAGAQISTFGSTQIEMTASASAPFKMVEVVGNSTFLKVSIASAVVSLINTANTDFNLGSNNATNLTIKAAGSINIPGLTASQSVFTDASKNLVSNAITGTGNVVMSASPTLTGTITAAAANFSSTVNISGLTASQAIFTDGSKNLVSNAITGTGNVVMSASPTLTGTITAAIANFSGAVAVSSTLKSGNYHIEPLEYDAGNSSTAQTIDWSNASSQKSTLTGSVTYTFSNPVGGGALVLKINTGAGSFTATWPATVHWSGGTAPTITTTASKVDLISFYFDGSTYFGTFSQNYAP